MNISTYLLITILLIICAFGYGYWLGRCELGDADVTVSSATGVIKKIIKKAPHGTLQDQLQFYKRAFNAKGAYSHKVKNDWIFITRSDGYTEEKHGIQIATKGNYKLYLGIAGLGILAGAAIMYKF